MSGMEGDDPGPSTLRMPVTPAGQVSTPTKRKVDLSKEELDLFERVGIDPGPLQRTQPRERPARRLSGNEGKQDDSSTKRRRVEGDLGETSSAETSKQKSVTQNVHPSRSSGDDDTPDPSPALLLDTFSKQHVLANSATSANLDTREMSRPGTAQSQRQRATQVSQTIQDTPTTPITRRFPPAPSNGIQGPATEPSKRAHNDKSAEDQRQKQKQEPVTDPVPRTRRQEPASAAYADSPLEQGRLQRRVPGTDATKMLAPTSDRKSKGKARAYPDTAAEAGLSEASDGRDPADRTGEENERVAGGSEASRNRARIRETRQKEMAELKANPLKYKGRGRYAASMPK